MRHAVRTLPFVLASWLGPATAQAEPHSSAHSEIAYQAKMFGTARYASFALALGRDFGSGLEAIAGARLLLGQLQERPGFSAFLRTSLYAVWRGFRPALGLELEAGSKTRASPSDELSGSLTRMYAERDAALLRAGLVLNPLRMQSDRLLVSLGALRLSTPVNAEAGQRIYVGVSVLDIGWSL